jgi:hypothetical protein
VPEMGGPRVHEMTDLIRGYLRASGKHRLIMPVRLPGTAARAFRAGANLAQDRAVGKRSWEDFLAERVGPLTGTEPRTNQADNRREFGDAST